MLSSGENLDERNACMEAHCLVHDMESKHQNARMDETWICLLVVQLKVDKMQLVMKGRHTSPSLLRTKKTGFPYGT